MPSVAVIGSRSDCVMAAEVLVQRGVQIDVHRGTPLVGLPRLARFPR
ncbi:MAG: hypothetical protein WBX11_07070 [Thiobacillaceae bacterium]|jgi:hypothetical protein